jgi:hypothetical protein
MFQRIVKFYPAYDRRDPNPSKNHGVHGVNLLMLLKGDKGCIQFMLSTNWMLPHVQAEQDRKHLKNTDKLVLECFYHPRPWDLGYHSYIPMYEGQTAINSCEWLDGKPCYYDGSSLEADRIYKVLLAEGDEGVWKALEEEYRYRFEPSVSEANDEVSAEIPKKMEREEKI